MTTPDRTEVFNDRTDAGERLAARLSRFRGSDGVVLALPRGGVPVAAPVAAALGWPLDLALVRKVGVPGHEELAVAAVAGADGEVMVVNESVARTARLDRARIEELADPERAELQRRRAAYGAPGLPLEGRTAILIDDGIATGATVRAAVQAIRALQPAKLVLAVPVAAPEALEMLRGEVDEVECLSAPHRFVAVGAHYRQFPQVSDDEVRAWLGASA